MLHPTRRLLRHSLTSGRQPRVSVSQPTPYSWVASDGLLEAEVKAYRASTCQSLVQRHIAIKENITYRHAPTTCSSAILKDFNSDYNATCVELLLHQGAAICGQTKMDEFGMGSNTTHLPEGYTPVYNPGGPVDDDAPRSVGGSSGGSAAAVAEGSCWAALGTDTGGSVRLPASYCGVVGLKPSYRLISRFGVVSYADSLDCVGILARDISIASQIFSTLNHPDPRDMTNVSSVTRQRAHALLVQHIEEIQRHGGPKGALQGYRIGIPNQTRLPSPHLTIPSELVSYLESQRATVVSVDIPSWTKTLPAYYVLASAEASSNLARYGGGFFGSAQPDGEEGRRRVRTEGFGREVKKRLLAGTYALSANQFDNTYLKALYLRRTLRREFDSIFRIPHPVRSYPSVYESAPNSDTTSSPPRPSSTSTATSAPDGVDVLLHPTAISTAPPLSKTLSSESEYAQDLLTVPASLGGLPCMSVPAGVGSDGWPIGMSVSSQWGMEQLVFDVGRVIEQWGKGQ
ncbi:hypothetical protein M231_00535 [Tremella mesenterica]|uniref:Amidase domain-containing protein n=1 Tax=Tremella mesenterica TaxID=5217 RepID=A0A4Q1BVP0_TREME|nr:hypothetical protein M231_00535 [Tremella mesenterica]